LREVEETKVSGKSGRRGKKRRVDVRAAQRTGRKELAPPTVRHQVEADAERQAPVRDLRCGYVAADLRRIGIIAGAMILVIIILFFFLN